jgi:hypothetical protein
MIEFQNSTIILNVQTRHSADQKNFGSTMIVDLLDLLDLLDFSFAHSLSKLNHILFFLFLLMNWHVSACNQSNLNLQRMSKDADLYLLQKSHMPWPSAYSFLFLKHNQFNK